MKTPKYDSHCIVCKKPCFAPRGNFNTQRVSLCKDKKCRRQRKTELQREARKQKDLFPVNLDKDQGLPTAKFKTPKVRSHRVRKNSRAARAERKRKFYSQVV
jgi:hypothetical protein